MLIMFPGIIVSNVFTEPELNMWVMTSVLADSLKLFCLSVSHSGRSHLYAHQVTGWYSSYCDSLGVALSTPCITLLGSMPLQCYTLRETTSSEIGFKLIQYFLYMGSMYSASYFLYSTSSYPLFTTSCIMDPHSYVQWILINQPLFAFEACGGLTGYSLVLIHYIVSGKLRQIKRFIG